MPVLRFRQCPLKLAVCRLDAAAPEPEWARGGAWCSVTRTPTELSVVCEEHLVPEGLRHQDGWAVLMLEGPFAFSLTGILASILAPLAKAKIPIFAVSTFDTDWVLVPRDKLASAVQALRAAGHEES